MNKTTMIHKENDREWKFVGIWADMINNSGLMEKLNPLHHLNIIRWWFQIQTEIRKKHVTLLLSIYVTVLLSLSTIGCG